MNVELPKGEGRHPCGEMEEGRFVLGGKATVILILNHGFFDRYLMGGCCRITFQVCERFTTPRWGLRSRVPRSLASKA